MGSEPIDLFEHWASTMGSKLTKVFSIGRNESDDVQPPQQSNCIYSIKELIDLFMATSNRKEQSYVCEWLNENNIMITQKEIQRFKSALGRVITAAKRPNKKRKRTSMKSSSLKIKASHGASVNISGEVNNCSGSIKKYSKKRRIYVEKQKSSKIKSHDALICEARQIGRITFFIDALNCGCKSRTRVQAILKLFQLYPEAVLIFVLRVDIDEIIFKELNAAYFVVQDDDDHGIINEALNRNGIIISNDKYRTYKNMDKLPQGWLEGHRVGWYLNDKKEFRVFSSYFCI